MNKLLFGVTYIIISPITAFAFSGEIEVGSTEVTLGEPVELSLTVEVSGDEQVEVGPIQGMEQFDIQGTMMRHSSKDNIVIVDGELQSERISTHKKTWILFPKQEGSFTFGPATMKSGEETVETNSVDIRIVSKVIPETTKEKKPNLKKVVQNHIEYKPKEKPYYFYIIFILGTVFVMSFVLVQRRGKKDKQDVQIEQKKINQEEKILSLPEIGDEQFYEKVELYLKKLLFDGVDGKINLPEMIESLQESDEQRKQIQHIFTQIEKGKYSDALINKGDLLAEIRDL